MIDPPYDHQKSGAAWLMRNELGLLADEMGVGKSRTIVMACDGVGARNVGIVCPASAVGVWFDEFHRRSLDPPELFVVSYDYVRDHYGIMRETMKRFDLLICDEAHYLKNPASKQTVAILGAEGLIHHADRSWFVTGTPAPNHAGELWSLLYTFGETDLSYDDFVDHYCNVMDHQIRGRYASVRRITGTKKKHAHEIREMLSYVMLRRTKSEVLKDLPAITFQHVTIPRKEIKLDEVTREKLRLEVAFLHEKLNINPDLAPAETDEEILKVLELFAQSLPTLRRVTGLMKVDGACEMIKSELEVGAYDKIVIFAVHKDVIRLTAHLLEKFNPAVIVGGTTQLYRDEARKRFQSDPECRVFIGNIQAAGTAITLTAASQMMFIEQDWVPGNNAQAAMRCHRIGQPFAVNVRILSLLDSVDAKIQTALTRKTQEIAAILH